MPKDPKAKDALKDDAPLTKAERKYLAHLTETEGKPLPKRLREQLEKSKAEEQRRGESSEPRDDKGRGR